MRRVLLGLLLIGCVKKERVVLDPTLPDGIGITAMEPAAQIEDGASSQDPTIRGLALGWKLRSVPSGELTRWVMQGTYDPDVWVQRQVTTSLLQRLDEPVVREMLGDYLKRGASDPYVRGHVAMALGDAGYAEADGVMGAWRGQDEWKVPPLALAALVRGETDALAALDASLRSAPLRDDDVFFVALGQSNIASLAPAAEAASALAEDLTVVRLSFARGLLGDAEGGAGWKLALRHPDQVVQQDAVSLLLALDPSDRDAWVAMAGKARDPGVREAAKLIGKPSGDRLTKALASEDVFVRLIAGELLLEVPAADASSATAAALMDDTPEVRRAGLRSVAAHRLTSHKSAATALLRDPREEVRVAAAGALLVLGE